jgi:hypothetical protein
MDLVVVLITLTGYPVSRLARPPRPSTVLSWEPRDKASETRNGENG